MKGVEKASSEIYRSFTKQGSRTLDSSSSGEAGGERLLQSSIYRVLPGFTRSFLVLPEFRPSITSGIFGTRHISGELHSLGMGARILRGSGDLVSRVLSNVAIVMSIYNSNRGTYNPTY